MPREGILDPEGAAIRDAARRLGFDAIEEARSGRVVVLEVADSAGEATIADLVDRLLVNPLIEECRWERIE